MRIEVRNRAPGQPEVQVPDYESESGRGLFLVVSLGPPDRRRGGCHPRPGHRDEHGTKCVWAEIPRAIATPAAQHRGIRWMPGPAASLAPRGRLVRPRKPTTRDTKTFSFGDSLYQPGPRGRHDYRVDRQEPCNPPRRFMRHRDEESRDLRGLAGGLNATDAGNLGS